MSLNYNVSSKVLHCQPLLVTDMRLGIATNKPMRANTSQLNVSCQIHKRQQVRLSVLSRIQC